MTEYEQRLFRGHGIPGVVGADDSAFAGRPQLPTLQPATADFDKWRKAVEDELQGLPKAEATGWEEVKESTQTLFRAPEEETSEASRRTASASVSEALSGDPSISDVGAAPSQAPASSPFRCTVSSLVKDHHNYEETVRKMVVFTQLLSVPEQEALNNVIAEYSSRDFMPEFVFIEVPTNHVAFFPESERLVCFLPSGMLEPRGEHLALKLFDDIFAVASSPADQAKLDRLKAALKDVPQSHFVDDEDPDVFVFSAKHHSAFAQEVEKRREAGDPAVMHFSRLVAAIEGLKAHLNSSPELSDEELDKSQLSKRAFVLLADALLRAPGSAEGSSENDFDPMGFVSGMLSKNDKNVVSPFSPNELAEIKAAAADPEPILNDYVENGRFEEIEVDPEQTEAVEGDEQEIEVPDEVEREQEALEENDVEEEVEREQEALKEDDVEEDDLDEDALEEEVGLDVAEVGEDAQLDELLDNGEYMADDEDIADEQEMSAAEDEETPDVAVNDEDATPEPGDKLLLEAEQGQEALMNRLLEMQQLARDNKDAELRASCEEIYSSYRSAITPEGARALRDLELDVGEKFHQLPREDLAEIEMKRGELFAQKPYMEQQLELALEDLGVAEYELKRLESYLALHDLQQSGQLDAFAALMNADQLEVLKDSPFAKARTPIPPQVRARLLHPLKEKVEQSVSRVAVVRASLQKYGELDSSAKEVQETLSAELEQSEEAKSEALDESKLTAAINEAVAEMASEQSKGVDSLQSDLPSFDASDPEAVDRIILQAAADRLQETATAESKSANDESGPQADENLMSRHVLANLEAQANGLIAELNPALKKELDARVNRIFQSVHGKKYNYQQAVDAVQELKEREKKQKLHEMREEFPELYLKKTMPDFERRLPELEERVRQGFLAKATQREFAIQTQLLPALLEAHSKFVGSLPEKMRHQFTVPATVSEASFRTAVYLPLGLAKHAELGADRLPEELELPAGVRSSVTAPLLHRFDEILCALSDLSMDEQESVERFLLPFHPMYPVARLEAAELVLDNPNSDGDAYVQALEESIALLSNPPKERPFLTSSEFVLVASALEPLFDEKRAAEIRAQYHTPASSVEKCKDLQARLEMLQSIQHALLAKVRDPERRHEIMDVEAVEACGIDLEDPEVTEEMAKEFFSATFTKVRSMTFEEANDYCKRRGLEEMDNSALEPKDALLHMLSQQPSEEVASRVAQDYFLAVLDVHVKQQRLNSLAAQEQSFRPTVRTGPAPGQPVYDARYSYLFEMASEMVQARQHRNTRKEALKQSHPELYAQKVAQLGQYKNVKWEKSKRNLLQQFKH